MFQEVPTPTPIEVKAAISASAAAWNALTTAISCFLMMLAVGYQSSRTRTDDFSFMVWARSNTSRFIVGSIILVGFGSLTYLTPDVSKLLLALGFNVDATVPVSFGLALAIFLLGASKKDTPPAD